METFKRMLIAAFAPAARHWALVEGNLHASKIGAARVSPRNPRGSRARVRTIRRFVFAR